MLSLGIVLGGLLIVAALGLAGMIAVGGPTPPPPPVSVRDAVLKRDRTVTRSYNTCNSSFPSQDATFSYGWLAKGFDTIDLREARTLRGCSPVGAPVQWRAIPASRFAPCGPQGETSWLPR